MELAHSLLLNEPALLKLPNDKRPVFVYEWLKFLDNVLPVANKVEIKEKQEHILKILLNQLEKSPGPPTRKLLGTNLATLFQVGDSYSLHLAINICNDLIKNKDDNATYLATKLAAIVALGEIYSRLGRMVGRSYEETISILLKSMKQAESQCRSQIMLTLQHVVRGLGSAAINSHRDILKITKTCLLDRSMVVRSAACKCFYALIENSPTLQSVDVESTVNLCFKTLEDSNYEVRCEMAKVLGFLLAKTQTIAQNSNSPMPKGYKPISIDDVFSFLQQGFTKSLSTLFKSAPSNNTSDFNKGNAVINREMRVGVTHAILELATCLGTDWLETRHLSTFLSKVLSLLTHPKSTPTHVEAVYARKCVSFILRSISRLLLSQAGQIQGGRELCTLIRATIVSMSHNEGDLTTIMMNQHNDSSQHVLVCALEELSCLIQTLNTAAAVLLEPSSSTSGLLDSVFPVLFHPSPSAQLAAAFTLRSLSEAIPAQRANLIDLCLQKWRSIEQNIETTGGSGSTNNGCSIAMLGIGYALGALISSGSGAGDNDNGRSSGGLYAQAQVIFTKAEEMLRSSTTVSSNQQANHNNLKLISSKIQTAWFLIGACCNLATNGNAGVHFVKSLLPKLLLLWRNAFPKSSGEIENEKQRGDSFTWQISLESRAGALCSIHSFLDKSNTSALSLVTASGSSASPSMSATNSPDSSSSSVLLTDDVLRRIIPIIESTLSIISLLPTICRSHGNHLKGYAAMLRLRLYNLLLILPAHSYSSTYNTLLRELVAEFTLSDNPANTTTSLLRSMCHSDDSVILGSWLQETDQKLIEDQLQPNSASGSGALEHDNLALILFDTSICKMKGIVSHPNPLPLGVSVIDSSVQLFGALFPRVQTRHRQQLLEHFSECLRQQLRGNHGVNSNPISNSNNSSAASRQLAIHTNILTALLCAMRKLAETKSPFGSDHNLKKEAANIIFSSLLSPNAVLRCAAGECLGRMAQVLGDSNFLAETAQYSCDRLRTDRTLSSRTGHSLALGCLHRYVGGLGSGRHLGATVGVLLALAATQEQQLQVAGGNGSEESTAVQVWALHALSLVADSGGPTFRRDYLELTLGLVLKLLLHTSATRGAAVHRCLGKLLGALVTVLGPELGMYSAISKGNSSSLDSNLMEMGQTCVVCCSLLQEHPDPLVQAEAISCLQQLHMFAPKQINITTLVGQLYTGLSSCHLLQRRAVVSCLRQLSQKESCQELTQILSEIVLKQSDNLMMVTPLQNNDSSINQTNYVVLKAAFVTHGLIGCLFQMLDLEQDVKLRNDLEDTLLCILQSRGEIDLHDWLSLLREVIQAGKLDNNNSVNNSASSSMPVNNAKKHQQSIKNMRNEDSSDCLDDEDDDDDVDDDATFQANKDDGAVKAFNGCRWPTKVFAAECFQKLIEICHNSLNRSVHFNMGSALATYPKSQSNTKVNSLILHLSELISFSFIAATQEIERLKLVGLSILHDVICLFEKVPEPEFPDQLLLEQYEAQITAALRPAFNQSSLTQGNITAMACSVCSAWIRADINQSEQPANWIGTGSRSRVLGLLKDCLIGRFSNGNEEILDCSIETISVLTAWAQIYLALPIGPGKSRLLPSTHLPRQWWQILTQFGIATLPAATIQSASSEVNQLPLSMEHMSSAIAMSSINTDNNHKISTVNTRHGSAGSNNHHNSSTHYWPVILLAAAQYLTTCDSCSEECTEEKIFLLLGLSVDAMCGLVSKQTTETIDYCLQTCITLLSNNLVIQTILQSSGSSAYTMAGELIKVVHRLLLTRDSANLHLQAIKLMYLSVGLIKRVGNEKKDNSKQDQPSTNSVGDIIQTPAFTCIEVIICGLTRYVPHLLEDDISRGHSDSPLHKHNKSKSILPLVNNSDPNQSINVVCQLVSAMQLVIDILHQRNTNATNDTVIQCILPSLVHLCHRVTQLEVIRCPHKSSEQYSVHHQSPIRSVARQRCSNDTSPWIDKVQENLSEQILGFYIQAGSIVNSQSVYILHSGLNQLIQLVNPADQSQLNVSALYLVSRIIKESPISLLTPKLRLQLIDKCMLLWQRLLTTTPNATNKVKNYNIDCVALIQSFNYLISLKPSDMQSMKMFARNLSELIIDWLFHLPTKLQSNHPKPESQENIVLLLRQFSLSVDFIENLLDIVENTDKSESIVATLLPLLILLLLPNQSHNTSAPINPSIQLIHKHALQRINSLAPRYTQIFRKILQSTQLKQRLESACKQSNNSSPLDSATNKITGSHDSTNDKLKAAAAQPKIALKMDFSNFGTSGN